MFPTMIDDCLQISGLSVSTRLGVPAEERTVMQRVKMSVTLWPEFLLTGLGDEFSRTVDYAEVAISLREMAEVGERCLIETLAEEAADLLLERFALRKVCVEVWKFILPDTDGVAVRLTKEKPGLRMPSA